MEKNYFQICNLVAPKEPYLQLCIMTFRKSLLCLFVLAFSSTSVMALDVNLQGLVKDKKGNLLSNAKVVITENREFTAFTNEKGAFTFEHISPGTYTILVSKQGFLPETLTITATDVDQNVVITLSETSLEISGITVTGKSKYADALTASQTVHVVEGRQLDRQRGENVMTTLNNTPGVSTLTTGAGTAKPVIRGLTGNRVLVLSDGIRQEEQQFGDDHTVDLDAFGIQRIEVVKGPGSILYGSDALGGVVNVIRLKAPTAKENAPKLAGNFTTNSFSNNKQDAGNIMLYGYNQGFGYRASVSDRKAGNISTPNGRLLNTGFKERNYNASVGTDGKWGGFYIDSFAREQIQDLLNNPNEILQGGKTFQNVTHNKTHANAFFNTDIGVIELDISYQRNNRREIPDKNIYVPIQNIITDPNVDRFTKAYYIYDVNQERTKQGLNLFLDTTTGDVKYHHKPIAGVKGTFGLSTFTQRNATIGTEPLIPSYALWNYSAYLLEEYKLGDFTFSAGIRQDRRNVSLKSNSTLGNPDFTKNFQANTGSVGIVYKVFKPFAIATNFGRGFRAPTPFELTSNGEHEGTGKFEIGNNLLKPEYSRHSEISFRFMTDKLQTELSIFQKTIDNFIYSVNTAQIDKDSSLPIYRYRQDNANLRGGEWSIQGEVTKWLVLQGGVDLLRGESQRRFDLANLNADSLSSPDRIFDDLNTRHGHALPRMTPNRARAGFRLTTDRIWIFSSPYFSWNSRIMAAQNRVDQVETRTPGYTLHDLNLGFELPSLGNADGDKATFDLGVQNIFNKSYVDHLSRYKDFALNPGINVFFKMTIPFTLISNSGENP